MWKNYPKNIFSSNGVQVQNEKEKFMRCGDVLLVNFEFFRRVVALRTERQLNKCAKILNVVCRTSVLFIKPFFRLSRAHYLRRRGCVRSLNTVQSAIIGHPTLISFD